MFRSALLILLLQFTIWTSARGEGQLHFDSLPFNFTLAAVNVTLPNANISGAPLVLGAGGATGGITFYVTSTWFSFPYNSYPSVGLVNGSLRAYDSSGMWNANASSANSGGVLGWSRSIIYPIQESYTKGYSALKSPSRPFPVLAAHGIADLWSLCPFPGPRGQTELVYNVSAVKPPPPYLGFDPDNCYDVIVNVLPTE